MRNRQVPYTELWKPDVNKNRDANRVVSGTAVTHSTGGSSPASGAADTVIDAQAGSGGRD
jgi:hypothetical protein